jgi:hypothetical protein
MHLYIVKEIITAEGIKRNKKPLCMLEGLAALGPLRGKEPARGRVLAQGAVESQSETAAPAYSGARRAFSPSALSA